ncbi:flagellar hook-length control protein FliK [Cupriavidus metallidurans]
MSWEVSPNPVDEDGAGTQHQARSWTTRLVVQMPGMGMVEASLTLSPSMLDVRVNAPLDDTAARLNAAIPDLHGRLAASGFVVGQITARADTAPTEAGVPS